MTNSFTKDLLNDVFEYLKSAKGLALKKLSDNSSSLFKKEIFVLILLSFTYRIFLPSHWFDGSLIIQLVFAPFALYFSVPVLYYFCQICLENFQSSSQRNDIEAKALYTFAYLFVLPQVLFCFIDILLDILDNFGFFGSLLKVLLASFKLVSILVLFFVHFLSVIKVTKPEDFSLITCILYFFQAIVEFIKNIFGINAWQEIIADCNGVKEV
jgi:hypothetical protein